MLSRLFYKLVILTLVGMLVAPFILKRENGTCIMSMEEFLDFDSQVIKERYKIAMSTIGGFLVNDTEMEKLKEEYQGETTTKLYKWKDEKGEWHFSDVRSDQYEQEEVEINNNRNVLKFEDLPKKEESSEEKKIKKGSEAGVQGKTSSEKEEGAFTGYIKNMTSTLQDARNVQSQVDQDYQRKTQAIDGDS